MQVSNRVVGALSLAAAVMLPVEVLAATAGSSAKLVQVQGTVMVNQGARFVKAASGAELKPSDKIVTPKGASAQLVYDNGCVKQLKENTLLTVGDSAACAAGKLEERAYHAEAIGDTAAATPAASGSNAGAPLAGAVLGPKAIIGALAAGGAIAAAASGGGSGGSNNASPQ